MIADASTTTGSTTATSWEAVASIDVGRHVQVNKDPWGNDRIFINLEPKVLMRKSTPTGSTKANAWSDWSELTLRNEESRDKLTTWQDQCMSNLIAKVSDGEICSPDQARDGWLEILEEGFKTETGVGGIFQDEMITLRHGHDSPNQTSSSSPSDRGSQGVSPETTARHPTNSVTYSGPIETAKTFSGGAETSTFASSTSSV
ncbi:hypothetical protein EHS25_001990 [Saitozyma podzolica]|uniref:Uncharacterized protein n=1 Tax=Saitozyma podzolica TaxID=1890683 RepID=A0A427YE50_9TREE|nr:hypothetical protein EHS25_001990 [Saitozyma podzolica]